LESVVIMKPCKTIAKRQFTAQVSSSAEPLVLFYAQILGTAQANRSAKVRVIPSRADGEGPHNWSIASALYEA